MLLLRWNSLLSSRPGRAGQPVGIQNSSVAGPCAFGNSDGDLQMLQYTAFGSGARFMLIVRQTDTEREFVYDRKSSLAGWTRCSMKPPSKGWTVIDMKKDWKTNFPCFHREDSE